MNHNDKLKGDIISLSIGDCGKWQLQIGILMSLLKLSLAWTQFAIVFLAPPQKFWCKNNGQHQNNTRENFEDQCSYMEYINKNDSEDAVRVSCTEFEYDKSTFHSSIVTEWDLVCSRSFLIEVNQISVMGGFLVGCLIFGICADKYGRKRPLMVAIIIQPIAGLCAANSLWLSGFMFSRIILSLAGGGISVVSFVICIEAFGGKWRKIVPILYHLPLGIGSAIMGSLAYSIRDWRNLQITLYILSLFYVVYIWLIPESPRWLLATNQNKKAIDILEKAAILNGRNPDTIKNLVNQNESISMTGNMKKSFSAALKNQNFKIKIILICIQWFGAGTSIYAFSQYLGMISENVFITFILVGFNIIPGMIICVILAQYIGHKKLMSASQLLAGACFFLILSIPKGAYVQDWPRILFACIGVLGIDVFTPLLYLYTSELFPTVIRNAAIGGATLVSRIGAMFGPLVLSFERISRFLPLSILGVLMILLTIFLYPLPEIDGCSLADNNQEGNIDTIVSDTKYKKVDAEQ